MFPIIKLNKQLIIKTPAKINLFLDVTKKYKNGYHEIKTVFQSINFFDTIIIKKSKKLNIKTNIKSLNKEKNIVENVFELLDKKYTLKEKVKIRIRKHIPMGAGLGGGSSDAAAVILGLNKLFNLNLSKKKMLDIGGKIGSDVNFFLNNCGTQFGTHFGEILKPINTKLEYYLILIYPDMHLSTEKNYNLLKKTIFNKGEKYLTEILAGIRKKNVDKLFYNVYNIFERVIYVKYPFLKKIKEDLLKNKAENALMSGSGSTIFGIYKDKKIALNALKILKKKYKHIYLKEPYYGNVQIF